MSDFKILFLGTPDYAKASLTALIEAGEIVCGVITQPDKKQGRGMKLSPCETKEYAMSKGIHVYQPETLKNEAILPLLQDLSPSVIVVAAYGKILPEYFLKFPKYGCINVHGSLLPKYRGAAPIQRAVMNGEYETGITVMQMDKGIDTGDMLLTEKTEIGENETSGELYDRLSLLGGKLIVKEMELLKQGKLTPVKQDDSLATYADKIDKSESSIDFSRPARNLHNLIRGLSPFPSAMAKLNGINVKLFESELSEEESIGETGKISELNKEYVRIQCGRGSIIIKKLKPEGSKLLTVADMINGRKISKEDIFTKY